MSIEIELRGKVIRGVKLYELVAFKMLKEEELPEQYAKAAPYTHKIGEGENSYIYIVSKDRGFLSIRFCELYTPQEMEARIETIKLAGKRLQKINAELAKENEGWEGSLHTIII